MSTHGDFVDSCPELHLVSSQMVNHCWNDCFQAARMNSASINVEFIGHCGTMVGIYGVVQSV